MAHKSSPKPAEAVGNGGWMKFALAPGLALVFLTTAAWGQSHDPSANGWFRASFGVGGYSVPPTIQGQVYNDSSYRVTNVRLRIEGLSADRDSVGHTFAWALGDIAPGGDTSFVVETIPGAVTYRISVVSFDVVSAPANNGGVGTSIEAP